MAPGSWSAPGNKYAVALAGGAAYCSRSGAVPAGHESTRALLPPRVWELCG